MEYSFEKNDKIIQKWRDRACANNDGDISSDGVYYKGALYLEPKSGQMWRHADKQDEQWNSAKRRILFISKDLNEAENAYDIRGIDLTHKADGSLSFGSSRFNNNLLRLTVGLGAVNKDDFPTFEKVSDIEFIDKGWNNTAIARINLKKHSGGSKCANSTLQDSINRYGDLILEQLSLLSANIIVCCGGSGIIKDFVIKDFLNESPEDIKSKSNNWIYYSKDKDIWVIDSYHLQPYGHSTDQDLYENVVKNLQYELKETESKI